MARGFTNDADLIKAIKGDKKLIQSLHIDSVKQKKESSNTKSKGVAKDIEEFEAAASILETMILAEFSKLPEFKMIYTDGMFAVKPRLERNNLVMHLEFSPRMYKKSKFQDHTSFVPILWEFGWSWANFKKNPYNDNLMRFDYYAGSHAITSAINQFNALAEDDGYFAAFMFGDSEITLKSQGLPYKSAFHNAQHTWHPDKKKKLPEKVKNYLKDNFFWYEGSYDY